MEVGQVGQNAVQVVVVVQTHLLTVVSERFGTKDFLVVSSLTARSRFEKKCMGHCFQIDFYPVFVRGYIQSKRCYNKLLKAIEGSQVTILPV